MRLHEITETHPRKKARRVGRGIAAGQGKTAGRGTKGQKSRTGANSNIPRTFEGGSTPLIQRLPKLKGFTSHREKPLTVNMARIASVFEDGAVVSLGALIEKGVISAKEGNAGIKIVGSSSPIKKKLTFETGQPKLRVSGQLAAKA